MKQVLIFFILFSLVISCTKKDNISIPTITVDLDNTKETIQYSQFAKSLDYIELNTNDSCIISGIQNIFLDDDTLILLDNKKAGILIFTLEGKFINQINHYGNALEEFISIRTFTIDPVLNQIYILDGHSQKINKYSYKGKFIESKKTTLYVRDFAVLKDEIKLCILPYYEEHLPYGIWTTDKENNIIKKIDFDIPKEDKFEFLSLYTNLLDQAVYYYDRNWDNLSYVTKDTAIVEYQFNLKQRLKEDLRKKDSETIPLQDFAMMWGFSNSSNFLLLTYYYYVEENPYRWVLYNKETHELTTSTAVINDIDYVQSSSDQIFYLSDKVWCRILDDETNNCNVQLQIINLK
ncbi:6-bladed beta-propeller [uncultured Parabacteroides sp.]|jgi:hypothetical protein|uniref:6-bladed beta-propeller n=1 Tax=uncultured Parabacteroides sp. TaxID=512312 RepID=UPI0025D98FFB|nr:6-bladed beta-propeller [uncultured Parabacteroides sp.]